MCYFKKKVHFEKQDSYLSHKWIFSIQPLLFIEHAIVYLAKKKILKSTCTAESDVIKKKEENEKTKNDVHP